MIRSITAALALSAALLVTGLAGGGPQPVSGPEAAEAACETVHHKKRIVKRRVIHRNGRRIVRRRVRWRRWTTCVPLPDPPPTVTPLGVPAYDTSNALCGGAEMCLRPTRSTVPAGPVSVELSNLGEDPHTLRLSKVGGGGFFSIPTDPDGEVLPGENERITFNLTAGEWYLFCSLGEGSGSHELLGMNADLIVD